MTFKKKANKEIKDEVKDILLEKEQRRQELLEAEAEWAEDYKEQFRRDRQREDDEFLEKDKFISESRYPEEEFPMN
jgi:hypothetical protein